MKNQKGFTLIELLIGLALAAIIGTGVYMGIGSTGRIYNTNAQLVDMNQNLRITMNVVADKLKEAGFDPTSTGFYGFHSVNPQNVTFSGDIDITGGWSAGDVTSFRFDSTKKELQMSVAPNYASVGVSPYGYNVLATSLDSVEFKYFDSDLNIITDPSQVKSIEIVMKALPRRGNQNVTKILTTRVICRNQ